MSKRFKLNKTDLPAIGWAFLAGLGVYTAEFATQIDFGALTPFVAMAVPTVIRWIKSNDA